jgi:predicted 3-demethylubiquinone-9 3-methyltransferase (glyoxalase superfamily)
MNFYFSIFRNSQEPGVTRYPDSMGAGVLTVEFQIEGTASPP